MDKKTMSPDKAAMLDKACAELLTYGVYSAGEKLKNFIRRYLLNRKTAPEDLIFWPTGLLAGALIYNRPSAPEGLGLKMDAALSEYFARWERRRMPVFYPDDLLAGESFLAIYEEYCQNNKDGVIIDKRGTAGYAKALDKLADYAGSCPEDETGSLFYRPSQNTGHIYADTLGLCCPFLYKYGKFMKKNEYIELAVKQIANFLAYGLDSATGLPYHGYDIISGNKYGVIGWGRAAGWLLRGMNGVLTAGYEQTSLRDAYKTLTDSVIKYQRGDGYFSWQLQALEGPADTSATGMICVSLQEGLKAGLLEGGMYETVLESGVRAIKKSIKDGLVYDCLCECEGFSQYPQRYGAYPWSLAPALMLDDI